MLPGVVFSSIRGSTKSSFRKTLILLGCSPPSKASGDSSITNLWASTISFESNLKSPFLPQEHLEGSLNFLSICKTDKIAPQLGHSNLAFTTCGRTSEACLTIPSIEINWSRCFALISLTFTSTELGKVFNLILGFFINPVSSNEFCKSSKISSGLSNSFSERTGENSAKGSKSNFTMLSSCLIDSPISFLCASKNFLASNSKSCFFNSI